MNIIKQGKTNWKYIGIVIFLALLSTGAIFIYQKDMIQEMVSLLKFHEIEKLEEKTEKFTLEELKDAEYYVSMFEETVQLEDGYYFRPWLPDSATGLRVEILDNKIAFGDLNNDGKEDAAVIVYSSGGGSGGFRELAIMINEDGAPSYLTSTYLGDRVIINSIDIQSGIITLDMIVHAPEDGMCCPSLPKIFKYRLSENQLVEVTEDEIANWKTYMNEEYGFEMKYPSNWIIVYESIGKEVVTFADEKEAETQREKQAGEIRCLVEVGIYNNDGGLSLYDWAINKWGKPEKREAGKLSEVKINDLEGIKYEFMSMGIETNILFSKDNKVIDITTTFDGCDNLHTFFNQMLSTFRFIEEEPYIKVISPNGGEEWSEGKTYDILWESAGVEKIMISVAIGGKDKGFITYGASIDAELGKYSWNIPRGFVSGFGISRTDSAQIRIYAVKKDGSAIDYNIYDGNDGYFSIIAE